MAKRRNDSVAVMEPEPVVVTNGAAMIEIPDAVPVEGSYIARETGDIAGELRGPALRAFRRFHAGLVQTNAKLPCGRPVVSKADALRWLFGSLAEGSAA